MNKINFFILFILSNFSCIKTNIFKNNNIHNQLKVQFKRNYSPYGQKYYENYLKNLNSRNITTQNNAILKKTKTEELEVSDKYNTRKKSPIMENEYYDIFGNAIRFENSKYQYGK